MNRPKNRTNQEISAPEVVVIAADGQRLGVMGIQQALQTAQQAGLDLVEVGPKDSPPICKLLDFGRFKFQSQRKQKQKSTKQQSKEIKFRPVTDVGDYQVKTKRIIKFLQSGARVQVTVRFRGREVMHAHLAEALLTRVLEDVAEYGAVEMPPKFEGRQMMMILKSK